MAEKYIDKAIAVKGLRMAHDLDGADFVANIPAANVRENVKGEWMRTEAYPHRIYCSVCYATFIRNDEFLMLIDIPHNYCPSCGAKMGGAEDG